MSCACKAKSQVGWLSGRICLPFRWSGLISKLFIREIATHLRRNQEKALYLKFHPSSKESEKNLKSQARASPPFFMKTSNFV